MLWIWSGIGLFTPFYVGISFWISRYFLDESLHESSLHWGIALFGATLLLLLTKWRGKKNDEMADKFAIQLESGEEMTDRKRKQAEYMIKNKREGNTYERSSLFYIPMRFWTYITLAGSVFLIVSFFVK